MAMSVYHLMELHRRLDDQIGQELRRRLPDVFRVQRLKKMKLMLKDRLARAGLGRRARTS